MTIGTEKSKKMTVPEWPRREISPTAFKAAAKIGGLSYPHKWKREQRDEVLKTKDRRGATKEATSIPTTSSEKHGRLKKAVV